MNSFNATISYDSEFEKMSSVTALQFFIEFAFGFKRFIFRIGILFCPDFSFFGMVGNNGNPKSGDVEKAFKKFFALDFGKFGIRILRKDAPNVLKREHFIAGSVESNYAVVNIAVERRKFSSGDYIITIHDFFVVKFNDATEIFGFKNPKFYQFNGTMLLRKKISYLFQNFGLIEDKNVWYNMNAINYRRGIKK